MHLCLALLGDGLDQRGCQMHSAHTPSMAGTWQLLHHYICWSIFFIFLLLFVIIFSWPEAWIEVPLHHNICCQIHLLISCVIAVICPWTETWLEHDSLYIVLFVAIFVAILIFRFFFICRGWNMAVVFVIFLSSSPFIL